MLLNLWKCICIKDSVCSAMSNKVCNPTPHLMSWCPFILSWLIPSWSCTGPNFTLVKSLPMVELNFKKISKEICWDWFFGSHFLLKDISICTPHIDKRVCEAHELDIAYIYIYIYYSIYSRCCTICGIFYVRTNPYKLIDIKNFEIMCQSILWKKMKVKKKVLKLFLLKKKG